MHGANQIEISGTNDNIEISNQFWVAPPDASWKLVSDPWNTNEPSRQMHLGVYHYNWSTISDTTRLATGIVNEEMNKETKIYPNPFNTSFTLTISPETTLKDAEMKIYNVAEKKLKRFRSPVLKQQLKEADCKSGMYFYASTATMK